MLRMLLDAEAHDATAKVRKQELRVDSLSDEIVRCIAAEMASPGDSAHCGCGTRGYRKRQEAYQHLNETRSQLGFS